jgi:hypothetical protein
VLYSFRLLGFFSFFLLFTFGFLPGGFLMIIDRRQSLPSDSYHSPLSSPDKPEGVNQSLDSACPLNPYDHMTTVYCADGVFFVSIYAPVAISYSDNRSEAIKQAVTQYECNHLSKRRPAEPSPYCDPYVEFGFLPEDIF